MRYYHQDQPGKVFTKFSFCRARSRGCTGRKLEDYNREKLIIASIYYPKHLQDYQEQNDHKLHSIISSCFLQYKS